MDQDRILLDVEAQKDFLEASGSCYTRAANKVASNIRRLFVWARVNEIPVISTVLRVRRSERGPLSPVPHCLEGSAGEQKMAGTLMPTWINLGLRNTTDLPRDIFHRFQQVIFEKRDTDILAHARLERLITELDQVTFIICGVGVAKGIAQAAIGLRRRRFGVIVAADGVLDLDDPLADMAYRRMEAKGVIFAATQEIVTCRPAAGRRRFRRHAEWASKTKTVS